MKPVISIIMPARNEADRVRKAVHSFVLNRSKPFPLEFIIVDDASEDGCCEGLDSMFHPEKNAVIIKVIKLDNWSGIPYARNKGAFAASGPILLITDANVESCPDWDLPIMNDLRPGYALCATIGDSNSCWKGYGCVPELPSMGVRWLRSPDVPVASCAGTVISKELFCDLGGYDTAMPVYGAAEPEFSIRLWRSGALIIACPDLVLKHRFRPQDERKPFLRQVESIQVHNYLRFGMIYLNDPEQEEMLKYWRIHAPGCFGKAFEKVIAGDAKSRRVHLDEVLPYDFDWYKRFFEI